MSESMAALARSVNLLAETIADLACTVRTDRPGELLTADELAERLKIPARTIKDQASAGLLPHHRFGKHYRFSEDDIAAILKLTNRQPTAGRGRGHAMRAA